MTISLLPGRALVHGDAAAKHMWLSGHGKQQLAPAAPLQGVKRRASGPGREELCSACFKGGRNIAEDGRTYCDPCLRGQRAGKSKPWKQLCATVGTTQDSDGEEVGLCGKCGLALGEIVYFDTGGKTALHGECVAQCMVDNARGTDEKRQEESTRRKQAIREEYGIGWTVERVPLNLAHAKKLGCELGQGHGLCSLLFDEETRSIRIVETSDAASCVNLEYLALALQVREREGREPQFSLDPLDRCMDPERSKQRKRFEPEWLMGTSMGEVMFQADYYLKELSMGEYDQPVTGMKSAFDMSNAEGWSDWSAREWYVVRSACVCLSRNNVLIPCVDMGVEAREQSGGPAGLEDAPITRPDHPLVRYAEQFTHYFDLIAERRSAVHHLRELAKATVLAKFLIDAGACLDSSWSQVVDWASVKASAAACRVDIPQLWKDQSNSTVGVRDGAIVGDKGVMQTHSVYGGVNFGLDRVGLSMYPPRLSTLDVGIASPSVDPATSIQAISGVLFKAQQGVDLDLGKFDLSAPRRTEAQYLPQAATGRAFWSAVEAGSTVASGLFQRMFNPRLSDRRGDGDRFVGPNTSAAYLEKLELLIAEEDAVRRERVEVFCSKGFAVGSAGALFPPSWMSTAKVDDWEAPRQLEVLYCDEADPEILRSAKPLFDKGTEDGLRFRIYREGALEVRTVQAEGGPEDIVAVFSTRPHIPTSIPGDEPIVKVRQYVSDASGVEAADEAQAREQARFHYFLLLQTQKCCIITERMPSGRVAWEESPEDLEARLSSARLIGSIECSRRKVLVEDLRAYWSLWFGTPCHSRCPVSASTCKRYVQTAFNWVHREVFGEGARRWDATKRRGAARQRAGAPERQRLLEEGGAASAAPAEDPCAALRRRVAPLFKVAEVLRSDAEVALAAMERDGLDLAHVPDELRGQREVLLAAMRENGMALQFAPHEYRSDREIVQAALQQDGKALQFASPELRRDRDHVLAAVQQDACALEHASEELRADRAICSAAAQGNSHSMRFAAEGALADRARILAAVGASPGALAYAPESLLADAAFMLAALRENGLALQFLHPSLRSDRDFVLSVVRTNGFALRVASANLRADGEVVLAAVQLDSRAVKYADREQMLKKPDGHLPAELYTLLEEPISQETAVLCPTGHRLRQFRAQHERFACDLCGNLIMQGFELWGCADVGCCFDLCVPCLEMEELGQPHPHAAKGCRAEPQASRAAARAPHGEPAFYAVGSWDGWTEFARLEPVGVDASVCCGSVALKGAPVPQAVSFQIVQDRSWRSRYHPSADGTSISGPDSGHGSNWEAWLPAGTTEFRVTWDPSGRRHVSWKPFGILGELSAIPRPVSGSKFSIAGSWDGWKEFTCCMPAGEMAFHAHIPVEASMGRVEFQVFVNRDWKQRFHPLRRSAGVVGPTEKSGGNWGAEIPVDCRWLRVVWYPYTEQRKVTWKFLDMRGVVVGGSPLS